MRLRLSKLCVVGHPFRRHSPAMCRIVPHSIAAMVAIRSPFVLGGGPTPTALYRRIAPSTRGTASRSPCPESLRVGKSLVCARRSEPGRPLYPERRDGRRDGCHRAARRSCLGGGPAARRAPGPRSLLCWRQSLHDGLLRRVDAIGAHQRRRGACPRAPASSYRLAGPVSLVPPALALTCAQCADFPFTWAWHRQ